MSIEGSQNDDEEIDEAELIRREAKRKRAEDKARRAEIKEHRATLMSLAEGVKNFLNPVDKRMGAKTFTLQTGSEQVVEEARRQEAELHAYCTAARKKFETLERTQQIVWPAGGRETVFDPAGKFLIAKTSGGIIESTVGQMGSSILWGAEYKFDHQSSSEIQLFVLIMQTYAAVINRWEKINALLETVNEQHHRHGTGRAEAYAAKYENLQKPYGELPVGLLAEKMALSLLNQITQDNPSLGYAAVTTPPVYDVSRKMDIFIADPAFKNVHGIQFVSTIDPEILALKERQLVEARRDLAHIPYAAVNKGIHLVAVDMSSAHIRGAYKYWEREQGNLAGGPEQFLPQPVRQDIVTQCMTPVIGPEKASELAATIEP